MMKKIINLMIFTFLIASFNLSYGTTFVFKVDSNEVKTVSEEVNNKDISRKNAFIFLGDYIIENNITKSYKYIDLKFSGINKGTDIYDALQKLVYLDVIENTNIDLGLSKKISVYHFYQFIEKLVNVDFLEGKNLELYKNKSTKVSDLKAVKDSIENISLNDSSLIDFSEEYSIRKKFSLFFDVYNTLNKNHFDKLNLDKTHIIESAIEGLTSGTGDKYTTYFPPVEKKEFFEHLNGEYDGIGAYVEMETPGVFRIISPLSGSPSEEAGIKGGDIIYQVDDKKVTAENSTNEVVSWIKGEPGTMVKLYILRGTEKLVIEVERRTIVIEDIEVKKIGYSSYYFKIKVFGEKVSSQFREHLEEIKDDKYTKQIIIDLRNNPGGYLTQVADMLGYFVPKGEKVAVVKYLDGQKNYKSAGYDLYDFSDKKIVILINGGSASASEIMAGTLKDYFPEQVTLVGEKSYGKGSVQTLKNYYDGSTLKYTIAKWFTGKTEIGIDGVGISPDIEIEYDKEKFDNEGYDNQLEKAKTIR